MPSTEGTPIDSVSGVPEELKTALKSAGIATIHQLVASTAAVGGPVVMAGYLGADVTEFSRVLAEAEAALPAAERARLTSPVDTSDLGLGALPPKEAN